MNGIINTKYYVYVWYVKFLLYNIKEKNVNYAYILSSMIKQIIYGEKQIKHQILTMVISK